MNIHIVYYSLYGHTHKMAEAIKQGAETDSGATAKLFQVPETLSDDIIETRGATEARKSLSEIPVATHDDLTAADAIIFGTPTRFGNMCGQMRQFLDSTGQLWLQGALIGKVGSVFASTATQHGGQESTILSFHITLLHQGMIIVGLPYSYQGQMTLAEISGGSPYGATTIAGTQGERMPSNNELDAARFQGKHVAEITAKLIK